MEKTTYAAKVLSNLYTVTKLQYKTKQRGWYYLKFPEEKSTNPLSKK